MMFQTRFKQINLVFRFVIQSPPRDLILSDKKSYQRLSTEIAKLFTSSFVETYLDVLQSIDLPTKSFQ